jgi:apolipoprotein N-acyltransferase
MLTLGRIVAALISGLLLAQAYGLAPFWALAWVAPIPLLIAVMGANRYAALGYGALAGVCSMALTIPYFLELSGVAPTLIIAVLKALTWGGMMFVVRASARSLPAFAAVFVYPSLMASFETLLAATSPHSTAGSLAYSQMDFLPAIQVASLGGVAAITFVLSLFASAVAFLIARRPFAVIVPAAIVVAALAFGMMRVSEAPAASRDMPGIHVATLSGDGFDFEAADWRPTWEVYANEAEHAALEGTRLILMPEKIVTLTVGEEDEATEQLAEIAREHGATLVVGAVTEEGERIFNRAYFITHDGVRAYDKQHMVPGFESHLTPGTSLLFTDVDGVRMGVVICKDMDFPALSRSYGEQNVDLMLVPAWDFGSDAWLHSRMAMLRGVESGFTIVRSAREGQMSVSDPYGRVLAEASSSRDVAKLAGRIATPRHVPTLYVRIGDAFGWLCLLVAVALIGWTVLARRRAGQGG